jgi:alcohol dehydrogenase (cytochrome c)
MYQATSLVADGILYTVHGNDVVALDGATGRVLWTYPYEPTRYSGRRANRGLAILGDTVYMGTLDAHLLAIGAYTGKLKWNVTVANAADPTCGEGRCYSITLAPLVVKDKVIVGPAGGEGLIRGFIAAFDAATGSEVWRFETIPPPGEPGNETWSGDSWKTGGAPVWNTGTYDPDLNLTYWGIGNPAPYDPNSRLGDNLYSNSVVALDADTGKLKWHYQFTPHDEADWDATQVPVLTDIDWQGRPRKVMLFANRNGLIYVLDRTTGQFLMGKPFVEVNWMSGFDEKGRPRRIPRTDDTPLMPAAGDLGATNWYPPSYSPNTGLFYVPSLGASSTPRYSASRALDPRTGEKKWEFRLGGGTGAIFMGGVLTTASDLLFTGIQRGTFYALDARTGQLLWQKGLERIQSGPISYSIGGKQYVAVAAGNTLVSFALKQ